jgi:hypothetical protein
MRIWLEKSVQMLPTSSHNFNCGVKKQAGALFKAFSITSQVVNVSVKKKSPPAPALYRYTCYTKIGMLLQLESCRAGVLHQGTIGPRS